jgi:hypothetical protein
MVDLAGIEPATSSMPWKRAPSCATGPLFEGTYQPSVLRTTSNILADLTQIVNARAWENLEVGVLKFKTGQPNSGYDFFRAFHRALLP